MLESLRDNRPDRSKATLSSIVSDSTCSCSHPWPVTASTAGEETRPHAHRNHQPSLQAKAPGDGPDHPAFRPDGVVHGLGRADQQSGTDPQRHLPFLGRRRDGVFTGSSPACQGCSCQSVSRLRRRLREHPPPDADRHRHLGPRGGFARQVTTVRLADVTSTDVQTIQRQRLLNIHHPGGKLTIAQSMLPSRAVFDELCTTLAQRLSDLRRADR